MCPHTTIHVCAYILCVLIRLYMCPHTTTYLSSYYHIFFLQDLIAGGKVVLGHMYSTYIYVSSYYYICVLILPARSDSWRQVFRTETHALEAPFQAPPPVPL